MKTSRNSKVIPLLSQTGLYRPPSVVYRVLVIMVNKRASEKWYMR